MARRLGVFPYWRAALHDFLMSRAEAAAWEAVSNQRQPQAAPAITVLSGNKRAPVHRR